MGTSDFVRWGTTIRFDNSAEAVADLKEGLGHP